MEQHVDTEGGFALLALTIYALVLYPRVEGYIDAKVVLLFCQVQHGIHPVPPILSETFRSLCYLREKGEGRFVGCAQLLTVWIFSHLPTMTELGYPQIKLTLLTSKTKAPLKSSPNYSGLRKDRSKVNGLKH